MCDTLESTSSTELFESAHTSRAFSSAWRVSSSSARVSLALESYHWHSNIAKKLLYTRIEFCLHSVQYIVKVSPAGRPEQWPQLPRVAHICFEIRGSEWPRSYSLQQTASRLTCLDVKGNDEHLNFFNLV